MTLLKKVEEVLYAGCARSAHPAYSTPSPFFQGSHRIGHRFPPSSGELRVSKPGEDRPGKGVLSSGEKDRAGPSPVRRGAVGLGDRRYLANALGRQSAGATTPPWGSMWDRGDRRDSASRIKRSFLTGSERTRLFCLGRCSRPGPRVVGWQLPRTIYRSPGAAALTAPVPLDRHRISDGTPFSVADRSKPVRPLADSTHFRCGPSLHLRLCSPARWAWPTGPAGRCWTLGTARDTSSTTQPATVRTQSPATKPPKNKSLPRFCYTANCGSSQRSLLYHSLGQTGRPNGDKKVTDRWNFGYCIGPRWPAGRSGAGTRFGRRAEGNER
jgi:hypothetical protein